jgi:hypothetical protein
MASLICSVLAMLVLAKTDPNIGNSADLTTRIATAVEIALNHRREHITRVEVHVTDETADPMDGVNQLRCAIEARLEHRQPIAVVHRAASVDDAVYGAAGRLVRMLDYVLGRTDGNRVES